MIRAVSLFVVAVAAALLAANFGGEFGVVEALLGMLVIIGFAIIATGWTVNHDV